MTKDIFQKLIIWFNSDQYETDSALSKEVWRIKRLRGKYTIKWSKEESHPSYKPEIKVCSLCQNEKLKIATYPENNLLNQRNEIISRCRHRLKFKLTKLIIWRQMLDYAKFENSIVYMYLAFFTEEFSRWWSPVNDSHGAWNTVYETKLCFLSIWRLSDSHTPHAQFSSPKYPVFGGTVSMRDLGFRNRWVNSLKKIPYTFLVKIPKNPKKFRKIPKKSQIPYAFFQSNLPLVRNDVLSFLIVYYNQYTTTSAQKLKNCGERAY